MEDIYLKKLLTYQNRIFKNDSKFRKQLKKDFKAESIWLVKEKGFDDEYYFMADDNCMYSFFVFRGNSGRIKVVEIARDYDERMVKMFKIKETESYKTVMKKAFWKKVLNNIIFFWLAYFITMGLLIMAFGSKK